MVYIDVYIEHENFSISKPFTYSHSTPLLPGVRVQVPFGRQKLIGLVKGEHTGTIEDSITVKPIVDVLDETPVLNEELMVLAEKMAYDCIAPFMSMAKIMLPGILKPSTTRKKKIYEDWLIPQPSSFALTKKQQEIMESITAPVKASEARKQFSPALIRALIQKEYLRIEKRRKVFGALQPKEQKPWPELNPMQQNALQVVAQADHLTTLLHGVTGSGKTEVFFHLMKQALEQGKQVLFLVPEISLTPMMVDRVLSRFEVPVFACHSRLSDAQMLDVYESVAESGPCIVIGTRKTVFLPFNNLGLIIMDEEHDTSYKQDRMPRYHARDAAIARSQSSGCPLILASATPSLESYARAIKGVYALAELPRRAAGQNANIHLVDLRTQRTYANLSSLLLENMQKRLDKKEKSLLLLNRRGFLPTIQCSSCHEFIKCDDCQLPLSYHKKENALVCHVCGKRFPLIFECPSCHSRNLTQTGQGTERLEEDLINFFPAAHIVRMDRDTTGGKDSHARLLNEFEAEGDILLGTQMIAKGLDFEEVTLAGILSVDSMLGRPDYLSTELAYQLIEQAAGRAGRGKLPGDVFIQTFNPEHYVMQCILNHDYRRFFIQEMQYRHAGLYPPYTFLATLVISHEDSMQAWGMAEQMKAMLKGQGLLVLGPMEISMRVKKARVRLIVKEKKDDVLKAKLWQLRHWFENNKGNISLEINMHPMMLEE